MKKILLIHLLSFFLPFHAQEKKIIFSEKAPAPIGAYSHAVQAGNWIFVSGQIGMNTNGFLDSTSVENQTRQAMMNIQYILESCNAGSENIVKTTIYLTNIQDFPVVNKVYASFFKKNFPAREVIQACALPKKAKVEISVIALLP